VLTRLIGTGHTIETSPAGRFYAVWLGRTLLDVGDRNGDHFGSRFVGGSGRLAWSPDDRWTAVATHDSVFLLRADEGDGRIRRLPIAARDLAWR
jgi:hypothetical protein